MTPGQLREQRRERWSDVEAPQSGAFLFVALVVVAALLSGCGASLRDATQRTLSVTSIALLEVDETIAPLFREAHQEHLAESPTREEYDRRMMPWVRIAVAAESARHSLLALQSAHDASSGDGFDEIAPCALAALRSLAEAVIAAGVDLPDGLVEAIGHFGAYADELCPGGES
ncbi:MAG: hypothetical protein AAGE52_01345 [Myxococcota bacterium]